MNEKKQAQKIFHTRALKMFLIAILFAIVVSVITGSNSVWNWSIPLGIAGCIAPHLEKESKS